jgi:N-acetylglucosamine-6-sulfatase
MLPRDFQVLPCRWVVERTFSWIDHNRRMSKDYERLPESSEAFIYVAMSRLMVRQLARESLQSVDELVEAVVNKLQNVGALDNTYVVFTSDNGYHHGEHRIILSKGKPYEESIRMPLIVRGPGVQAGSSTDKLTLNTDFLPTFTDLAGITTPEYVDGRSLRPVLQGSTTTTWRTAILLELRSSIYGIRTSDDRKYIEYGGAFKELYDLKADPYELNNSYAANSAPADLSTRLRALMSCAGSTCRAAEDSGP